MSRSRRLLPATAHQRLDETQQNVIEYLDHEIDRCRDAATCEEWRKLYVSLLRTKRAEIDALLATVTDDLRIYGGKRRH